MDSLWVDLGILLFVAGAGAFAGWVARWVFVGGVGGSEKAPPGPEQLRQVGEILSHLQQLAGRVAADVGQHTHRVETISEQLHSADKPAPDVVVRAIGQLLEANTQMQQKLAAAEQQLQEQAKQIEAHITAARTDALTGLANRRAFDEELARRHAEFQRLKKTFSVIMVDVDHFKKFNDTYGHQAGDEVLRQVARILRDHSRAMDLVARYGGEEFALICPAASADVLKEHAERLRQAIEAMLLDFEGKKIRVTASFGLAHLLPGEEANKLVERADQALYASKQAGRNCVHWHDGQRILPYQATQPTQTTKSNPSADPSSNTYPVPCQEMGKPLAANQLVNPARKEIPSDQALLPQPLESFHSRSDFCVILGRRLAEWRRTRRPLSVLLLQVDNYLELAAKYGLQAAQLTLRATSQFLQAAVRQMDVIAQYDNSTFALLLPEASLKNVADIAERLREAICRCKLPLGSCWERITVSIGAAEVTLTDDLQRLLERCEEALEQARSSGGNRVCVHTGQKAELVEASVES
ncbi:MAG: GGDEF domain-containing protein [Thermoguttaceae bacterium]|nr:GGDEF domain-containing protein [Thermoguttaceae bacterium]